MGDLPARVRPLGARMGVAWVHRRWHGEVAPQSHEAVGVAVGALRTDQERLAIGHTKVVQSLIETGEQRANDRMNGPISRGHAGSRRVKWIRQPVIDVRWTIVRARLKGA